MIHLLLAVIYISFISLGLPDSLLGAAWPSMYGELGCPVSFAGMVSMIIALGTIVSSLQSDRLTRRLGTGSVTAFSVGTTALALFGFSVSHSFWALCLWAGSYLVLNKGVEPETAAGFSGLFFIGITAGRALSGFLTVKLNDGQMVRLGQAVAVAGCAALLLPLGEHAALTGLILIGLGCAPIYPCIIHATPAHFGADRSQAIIGVQMASAYVGTF